MTLDPNLYSETPVLDLLRGAARGSIGVDQRLVRSILDRGEGRAADVLAFSREPEERYPIDLTPLLIDLLRDNTSGEALEFFIDATRRSPEDVDDELIQAFLPFGAKAIDPLLGLYEQVGEEQGSDVAFLLAGLHVHDPRILTLLLDRLEFDAADGAFCLGLYHDEAARPALEKMLAEIPKEETELLREIQHAIEELDTPSATYEPEALDILKEYPERSLPAFDMLPEAERLELFSSPDGSIRAGAAHSFFNHELDPKTRDSLLVLAQNDPDANVRGRAWESLGDATSVTSIREAMTAVLSDTSRDVAERGGAAVGLYAVADQDEPLALIESLYAEGGLARAKALESMWRSLWKPFSKYFARHLDDSNIHILRQALRGAGYFQLSSHIDKIGSYFDREGDLADLRDDALFAYALAMPAELSRGRVRGMLRKIDSIADLSPAEVHLVQYALDERLQLHGLDPVFANANEGIVEEPPAPPTPVQPQKKPGRNDPCPCGSGKKYKKCHGA